MLVRIVSQCFHRFLWFSEILTNSQWFSVLNVSQFPVGSHRFSVVLRGCRMFLVVLYYCNGSSVVLVGSCRFSAVLLILNGSLWFFS